MQPTEKDYTYLIGKIAQSLVAVGGAEEFYIWKGCGGNDKAWSTCKCTR